MGEGVEKCEIEVVNPSILSKIESFFNDATYRETIENSATYNTRLCIERRLRMPFLDSQTGVAQNHSNLFMSSRERMPGLVEGQIYTYPSKRWRKKRRQYLMNFMQPRRKEVDPEADLHTISTVENPAVCNNEDSKESVSLKEEAVKDAWYYDELDMQEMEAFDDPDPDSDYDYEESYTKRKKKSKKTPRTGDSPAVKKPKGQGRGRKKTNYDAVSDAEKPFACERGSSRRGRQSQVQSPVPPVPPQPQQPPQQPPPTQPPPHAPVLSVVPPPVVPPLVPEETPSTITTSPAAPVLDKKPATDVMTLMPEEKDRAAPSPYCDFCLGDAQENKKTGHSEELVSCSDCGRSGHPTCLQFTPNMIISVRKYRWQCIECKCCSICGNSDNDDQLLFCDDCDRGYHMYCLAPPLATPPEGSWSCRLCLVEFHKK